MKNWNSNKQKKKFRSWEVLYLPEETAEFLVNVALLWGPQASPPPPTRSSGVSAVFWQAKPQRSPYRKI